MPTIKAGTSGKQAKPTDAAGQGAEGKPRLKWFYVSVPNRLNRQKMAAHTAQECTDWAVAQYAVDAGAVTVEPHGKTANG